MTIQDIRCKPKSEREVMNGNVGLKNYLITEVDEHITWP
jgi:hypothetical protein